MSCVPVLCADLTTAGQGLVTVQQVARLKDRTTPGQAGWGVACTQKAKGAASSAGPRP